jgi:hypothetical protein
MVKRVEFSTNKFKVSRPTFDVDTAADENIAFDAFSGRYNGIYTQGTTRTDDGTWGSSQTGNVYLGQAQFTRLFRTISLGKTFFEPPQIIYMLRQISNPGAGAFPRYSHVRNATNGIVGTVAWASTTTTTINFRVDYPTFGTGGGATDWEFSYLVFQT